MEQHLGRPSDFVNGSSEHSAVYAVIDDAITGRSAPSLVVDDCGLMARAVGSGPRKARACAAGLEVDQDGALLPRA